LSVTWTFWLKDYRRAGWPALAHTVAICEGLEDWGATDLSNISDSDDEQPTPLVGLHLRHVSDRQLILVNVTVFAFLGAVYTDKLLLAYQIQITQTK